MIRFRAVRISWVITRLTASTGTTSPSSFCRSIALISAASFFSNARHSLKSICPPGTLIVEKILVAAYTFPSAARLLHDFVGPCGGDTLDCTDFADGVSLFVQFNGQNTGQE